MHNDKYQCHMAAKLHLPTPNRHLLAAQQEPYNSSQKKCLRVFWKKSGERTISRKKWQDGKSKRTRQKNKRGDRKGDSNDSPEIPDRGQENVHPRPPFREGDPYLQGLISVKTKKHTFGMSDSSVLSRKNLGTHHDERVRKTEKQSKHKHPKKRKQISGTNLPAGCRGCHTDLCVKFDGSTVSSLRAGNLNLSSQLHPRHR